MKLVSSNNSAQSRAETVRQRRADTGQERASRAHSNVVSPRRAPQPPPVTMRGRSTGIPVHQKTQSKVRRQYYYSLGASGAEVRLPAVPIFNPGWRLLSAAIVLALLFGLYTAYNSPTFQVNGIKITGLQRIKPAEMEKKLDLRRLAIFEIDPASIKASLEEEYPELTDIQIKVDLPAAVSISAVERQPILAWKYKEETFWVDKTGYIFTPRGKVDKLLNIESDEKPPVIVETITIESGDETDSTPTPEPQAKKEKGSDPDSPVRRHIDPVVLQAALDLRKSIPGGTTLAYTSTNGLGWVDPAGWTVYVGLDLENIDLKLKVYRAVVAKLDADGIKPAMISVENLHAPFYRLEQ